MSSARAARVRRLLAVETTRVAARERELGEARRAVAELEARLGEARAGVRAAEARWLEADTSAELLERASAHRAALERRAALAQQALARAEQEAKAREGAAIAARISERRFELLIEGFEAADDARVQKAERRAADEHAARKAGNS